MSDKLDNNFESAVAKPSANSDLSLVGLMGSDNQQSALPKISDLPNTPPGEQVANTPFLTPATPTIVDATIAITTGIATHYITKHACP